jgi:D-3-phosphoglycerate dehydrogenase
LKPKVLIADEWFSDRHLARLQEKFDVTSNTKRRWLKEDELLDIIGEYDAIIAGQEPYTRQVLENARKLKIIARRGIGYDNIDLDVAKKLNISVTNTPVQEEYNAVAEFTVALILNLLRGVSFAGEYLKSSSYKSTRLWKREDYFGKSIRNVSVGILGLGRIGRLVADILTKLESNVIYCDPYVQESSLQRVSLSQLFEQGDVVTLHVRSNDETRGMITYDLLSRMRKGSYFVNTARPDVVKTDDLKLALRNGILAAAAIDVFDMEPPLDDELLAMKNVVVTPHIAGFTLSSLDKIDGTCTDNVMAALVNKGTLKHRVV